MTQPAPEAQPGRPVDPYRAYNFKLSVQGVVQAHFTKVDGLGVKIPRILYREAGLNSVVRSIPGPVEYATVTLRYGMTDSTDLVRWLYQVIGGQVDRRNVSLAMLDDPGRTEVRRWDLIDAWPCEWNGAPLDAMGQELAIETLGLAFDRLELFGASPTVA
jgi:phage tail-like protein